MKNFLENIIEFDVEKQPKNSQSKFTQLAIVKINDGSDYNKRIYGADSTRLDHTIVKLATHIMKDLNTNLHYAISVNNFNDLNEGDIVSYTHIAEDFENFTTKIEILKVEQKCSQN